MRDASLIFAGSVRTLPITKVLDPTPRAAEAQGFSIHENTIESRKGIFIFTPLPPFFFYVRGLIVQVFQVGFQRTLLTS